MANITTTIRSILAGTKTPTATTSEMKNALGTLYTFVTDLLGTDSSNKAAARVALGAVDRAGIRNVLINGDFRINQRIYLSNQATGQANQYTFDRWRLTSQGTAMTYANDGNGRIVTVPAGGVEQIVEGDLIEGGTYYVDWTGTATCTVNGTAVTKGGSVTLTAAANTSVKFFGGTLTRAMLTPGAPGLWEVRPLALETMLCLRYYERTAELTTYSAATGGNYTVRFTATKRLPVTVSVTNISGSVALVAGSIYADQFTVTSSGAAGVRTFSWIADAELTAV